MYVPNHEKWLSYYQKQAANKEASPVHGIKPVVSQDEGGIATLSNQFILPIERRKVHKVDNNSTKTN